MKPWHAAKHLILVGMILLTNLPFYFMLESSLKSELQLREGLWAPTARIQWRQFAPAWRGLVLNRSYDGRPSPGSSPLMNSLLVSAAAAMGVVVTGALAAFGFARYRFLGKSIFFFALLALLMLPLVLVMIPEFLVLKRLGLTGPHSGRLGLILLYMASGQALAVFMLRTAFEQIPRDHYDSAEIDGAGMVAQLRHVALPLARPTLIVIGLLTFAVAWNDFIWPLILIGPHPGLHTVALSLAKFSQGVPKQFSELMAAYVLGSLPIVALLLAMLNYFIRGLTAGSLTS